MRRAGRMLLGLALAASTACSADVPGPVTDDPWVDTEDPPLAYCSATESGDQQFWELVHSSCRIAGDGDLAQAEALRQALAEEPTEVVADFQRTLVRANRSLRVVADVADDICAPGLGLGDDLGTDYRSWVIAHGQAAYEAVLADPEVLRTFPDAASGCGLGEPFGATAYDLYLERTGLSPRRAGLPSIESAG